MNFFQPKQYYLIKQKTMIKQLLKLFAVGVGLCIAQSGFSQTYPYDLGSNNPLETAVPFLRVSPDARSGAMGDIGTAISPDANAVFWNSAKLPFADNPVGISLSYTPWLANLEVSDLHLLNLGGYYKLDEEQVINVMVKYFSLGELQVTNSASDLLQVENPQEFAIQGGYSRKLSEAFGIGVNLKWIHSDLTKGNSGVVGLVKAGTSVAGDINAYFDPVGSGTGKADWAFGATISNLGAKIEYVEATGDKDFLPTNLSLGANLGLDIDKFNDLSFGLDINKLLVPTPEDNDDTSWRDESVISSIFSSWGDAPDGFSEELKEFQVSIGGEYGYNDQFFGRAGFFYENDDKGARQYATLGAGLKYNVATFNFAYLLATGDSQSPLDKTLRFSLNFDLE